MTALNTLQFAGFVLRPAGEGDRALAEQWTAWDVDHTGQIDPAFWLEQQPGVDSVLVSDAQGAVFFFKTALLIERVQQRGPLPLQLVGLSKKTIEEFRPLRERIIAQVFIQFMPCATEEERERTRQALIQGLEWLVPVLAQSATEEIFFDSRSEKLISFCVKRLGFKVDPQTRCAPDGGQPYLRLRKILPGPGRTPGKTEGV